MWSCLELIMQGGDELIRGHFGRQVAGVNLAGNSNFDLAGNSNFEMVPFTLFHQVLASPVKSNSRPLMLSAPDGVCAGDIFDGFENSDGRGEFHQGGLCLCTIVSRGALGEVAGTLGRMGDLEDTLELLVGEPSYRAVHWVKWRGRWGAWVTWRIRWNCSSESWIAMV
ncbi:hypothetical protein QE152_g8025 [Popillia japonica]|uniref:Uncharacterized protein n=1 Tax=Popillia japonica TaxID=7064 RepID=A0AAW1M771_POPJA